MQPDFLKPLRDMFTIQILSDLFWEMSLKNGPFYSYFS